MRNYARLTLSALVAAMVITGLLLSLGLVSHAADPAAAPAVLNVDEFMKNVDRYRGRVTVEGVVNGVAPEQQALSLIDDREFQACGVTTCAQLILPVQWRGPMPAIRDLVRIEGEARETGGKLVFAADKLEKAPRP